MPRTTSLKSAALALGLLAGTALAVPRAGAFEVFRHLNLSAEVLTRQGVGGTVLSLIKDGAAWPDINGCTEYCYCPSFLQVFCTPPSASDVLTVLSPDHFDNNRLFESIMRVNSRLQVSRGTLLNTTLPFVDDHARRAVAQSVIDFGKALHTIQDFYAHSTYLECNVPLIRVSGDVLSVAEWNGEDYECGTIVGTTLVSGIQTGYVEITPPAGSVLHDLLNKDKPSSTQGAKVITRVFGGVVCTYYEAISGQFGGSTNPYTDAGLASRHTIKAWNALMGGGSVYDFYPLLAKSSDERDPRVVAAERAAIGEVLNAANADPYIQSLAAQIESALAGWDGVDPDAFPIDQFDSEGLPLVSTDAPPAGPRPGDRARLLRQNVPNPFNPTTSIAFEVVTAGNVTLRVFDARGQLVRTLVDADHQLGAYAVTWDGTDDGGAAVPSGQYFYRICQGDRSDTRRMILAK